MLDGVVVLDGVVDIRRVKKMEPKNIIKIKIGEKNRITVEETA